MKRKIWVVGVLTLLLTLVLSGCFVKTVDELYTLPKHSDEYNDLQNAIDGLMAQGAAYSAPVSGANQQSVQLAPVQPVQQAGAGLDHHLGREGLGGPGAVDLPLQAGEDLGQLAVGEKSSLCEDQKASPFPSRSAAPAAQV